MEEKKPCTIKYITQEQYEEIITKGSTVIDGETVSYGDNLSDKDSNDMFDETVIDTLKEMAVKHSNDSYVYRVLVNAINLIHRLQDDNERRTEHVEKCLDEIDRLKTANAKQQAEIELLKKRHGVALLRNDDLDLENYELKKQVEAWKARAKELEQSWEISSSNEVALQKQVDELKSQNEWLTNEKDYLKQCADAFLGDYKNSVKDTAKEILQELYEYPHEYHDQKILEIARRKGVEVE